MRSSRKVVALVRVVRANAEKRGERVGEPCCGTGAKWRLADAQSGRKAMSQPKEGEADDEARKHIDYGGEGELLLPKGAAVGHEGGKGGEAAAKSDGEEEAECVGRRSAREPTAQQADEQTAEGVGGEGAPRKTTVGGAGQEQREEIAEDAANETAATDGKEGTKHIKMRREGA